MIAGLIEAKARTILDAGQALDSLGDLLVVCTRATERWSVLSCRCEDLEQRLRKAMEETASAQVESGLWQQRALVAERKLEQIPMVKE